MKKSFVFLRVEFYKIEKCNRVSKMPLGKTIERYPEVVRDINQFLACMLPIQVSVEHIFLAIKVTKSDLKSPVKKIFDEINRYIVRNLSKLVEF